MKTTEPETLELAPQQEGERPMKQLAPFSTLEQEARKMIADAEAIAILPPTPANAKVARTMRLEIRPLRTAVEKRHAELKRPILDAGNALDDGKNALLDLLKPMEAKLLAIEQHAEIEEARIQMEKRTARHAEITPFLHAPVACDLGVLSDADYAAMLGDAKAAHAAKVEREAKEKADAKAKAKAEADRIEAQRVENDRLKAEAAEREEAARKEREEAAAKLKAEQVSAEAERVKAAAALKKTQDEAAAEARKAKEKADAEARKLREELEAKAKADREQMQREAREQTEKEREKRLKEQAAREVERQKLEAIKAELEAKKAADAKAEADKLAAERAAAAAPDKEKLMTFAATIRALAIPALAPDRADLAKKIAAQVEKFAAWVESQAETI